MINAKQYHFKSILEISQIYHGNIILMASFLALWFAIQFLFVCLFFNYRSWQLLFLPWVKMSMI